MVFTDYCRPSIRLAALMGMHVIFVFTHDSIGVGEDGPTHQPVEQLTSLRAIPNLTVIRPGDANEAVEAWRVAMTHKRGPVLMALVPAETTHVRSRRDGVRRLRWRAAPMCSRKPRASRRT